MAKQRTKLKEFFEGRRRRCVLQDFHVLKNAAGILQIKQLVHMPLSAEPTHGMPDRFMEPYLLMIQEKSAMNDSRVNVAVEGAQYDIFTTDTISGAAVRITGATLHGFKLVGEGVDDKRTVHLEFVAYLPVPTGLKDWSFDHLHKEFFLEVTPAQAELDLDPVDPPPNKKKKAEKVVLQ